jgi:hypothetical protein
MRSVRGAVDIAEPNISGYEKILELWCISNGYE